MLTTTRDQASNENDPASFAILVVDDVPSYRTVLELALAGPGRDIVSVGNVDSASELMGIRRFGLVISDYSMPGGTGIDLLRKIRRTDRVQPFVLMSSDLPRTWRGSPRSKTLFSSTERRPLRADRPPRGDRALAV